MAPGAAAGLALLVAGEFRKSGTRKYRKRRGRRLIGGEEAKPLGAASPVAVQSALPGRLDLSHCRVVGHVFRRFAGSEPVHDVRHADTTAATIGWPPFSQGSTTTSTSAYRGSLDGSGQVVRRQC